MHPDDRRQSEHALRRLLADGITDRKVIRFRNRLNRWRWLDVSGSLLKRAEEPVDNILLVSRDITESKETEARLEHMALNDPLTDLRNRERFGRIKRGFAQERFYLFYQPIIDLKTGERYCSAPVSIDQAN